MHQPAITVDQLGMRYDDRTVLADVSFTVQPGEIFGILGRNGAGKTTTVESIVGLRTPTSGAISVFGHDPLHEREQIRRIVSMQLQSGQLPAKLEVGEALDLFGSFYPDPADTGELLAMLGLTHRRNSTYAKLSGGEKQRLAIAIALIGNPRVAIFDEITAGLDPQARRDVWDLIELIRERGVTVVLVSHFMDEVERLCDRLAILHHGRILATDSPDGFVGRLPDSHRLRFRPGAPIDPDRIRALPEVANVESSGDVLTVAGNADVFAAVNAMLRHWEVEMHDPNIDRASLEDAFLAMTGERLSA